MKGKRRPGSRGPLPKRRIDLTEEQLRYLEGIVRNGNSEQRLARRARILLMAHEGETNVAIAEKLDLNRVTVQYVRKRFTERGLDCLYDLPRPGRPRAISPLD